MKNCNEEMMKNDFIKELKKDGVFSTEKEAKEKLDGILKVLSKCLIKNKKVSFVGFGKFIKSVRKEQKNVKSHLKTINEKIDIPEKITIKFNMGKY